MSQYLHYRKTAGSESFQSIINLDLVKVIREIQPLGIPGIPCEYGIEFVIGETSGPITIEEDLKIGRQCLFFASEEIRDFYLDALAKMIGGEAPRLPVSYSGTFAAQPAPALA